MSTIPLKLNNQQTREHGYSNREESTLHIKSKSRITFMQLYHAMKGAVASEWLPVSAHHPLLNSVSLLPGGTVQAVTTEDEEIEVRLGKDFGAEFSIKVDASLGNTAYFIQRGKYHFDIEYTSGCTEHFRNDPLEDQFQNHRLLKDLCKTKLYADTLKFSADGHVIIGAESRPVFQAWSYKLTGGTTLVCDGTGHLLHHSTGRKFCYRQNLKRWAETFIAGNSWRFHPIASAETSVSSEVLGLVTLFTDSAGVQLWNTHSMDRFEEIDEALVENGDCQLLVRRAAGSDLLYLFEDGADKPTGACLFAPNHLLGRDQETYYNAWLFAASNNSIPLGTPGTSPLGTLLLLVAIPVVISFFFSPQAVVATGSVVSVTYLGVVIHRLFSRFITVMRA